MFSVLTAGALLSLSEPASFLHGETKRWGFSSTHETGQLGAWSCTVLFQLALHILYMQTEICQSQIVVQGAMDAHWAVGHSLASLARTQSAGCCVRSRFNAQRSSTHRPRMLCFPLKKWSSLLWGGLASALLDACGLRGTRQNVWSLRGVLGSSVFWVSSSRTLER